MINALGIKNKRSQSKEDRIPLENERRLFEERLK